MDKFEKDEYMDRYIVNPIKVRMKESAKGSIYKAIVALGFRARQINDDFKEEIRERMADIIPTADDNEVANSDQLKISKEFDQMPKPSFLAMKEIYDDDLKFEIPKEFLPKD